MGALGFTAFAGLSAALAGGVLAAVLLMGAVNMSGAIGKLAFDSIVQRNAPDANQGRAFAQFETKFQLAWVMAGIVPVLLPIPGSVGFAIVGGLALFAAGHVHGEHAPAPTRPADPGHAQQPGQEGTAQAGGASSGGNADGRHPPTAAPGDFLVAAAATSRPDARPARSRHAGTRCHIPPTREPTGAPVPRPHTRRHKGADGLRRHICRHEGNNRPHFGGIRAQGGRTWRQGSGVRAQRRRRAGRRVRWR